MSVAEFVKSTHKVEVVPVELRPHPNADALSIVKVFGYFVCVRTEDWQGVTLGAYVPPDSVVDTTRPEFAFLAREGRTTERIRTKKLRGVQSWGLLIPAPEGASVGDDVAEHYGVTHYEPPITPSSGGEAEAAPSVLCGLSKYDVDSLRRYEAVFDVGEPVFVTEKIHGASARYAWVDDRMYCGSRTEWKRQEGKNLWWSALSDAMIDFCQQNPGFILYGEVYGQVQSLKYGVKSGARFVAFDVLSPERQWLDAEVAFDLVEKFNVPHVPILASPNFDLATIYEYAEGASVMPGANHVREGCVVKPLKERRDERIGRVQLKIVGAGFLENDKG